MYMRRAWTMGAVVSVAVGVAAAGCGQAPVAAQGHTAQALATVNGSPVTQADVANFVAGTEFMQGSKYVSNAAEKKLELKAVVAQAAVTQWTLDHHLITMKVAQAQANAILKSQIEAQLSAGELQGLLKTVHLTKAQLLHYLAVELVDEKAYQTVIKSVKNPTAAQEQAYYSAHKSTFTTLPQDEISDIVVKSSSLAQTILTQARAGASFPSLAKQYSVAPNAKKGGSMGFVTADQTTLGASLYKAVRGLKAGQYAAYHDSQGYHVVWLQADKPASYQPLAQVRSQVALAVGQNLDNSAYQQWVNQLEKKDHIHYPNGK